MKFIVLSITSQCFFKNSKGKSKMKSKKHNIYSWSNSLYLNAEIRQINNCESTIKTKMWNTMDTQRTGIILNWEAKYDFMQETEVQVKPDCLDL